MLCHAISIWFRHATFRTLIKTRRNPQQIPNKLSHSIQIFIEYSQPLTTSFSTGSLQGCNQHCKQRAKTESWSGNSSTPPLQKRRKCPAFFPTVRAHRHTHSHSERNGNGNARSRILICMRNFACELYAKNGAHMSANWRLWQHPTPHNEPPKKPPNPLHAPMWCALEFHAFICKDYEMRPVAAKVLYALPAAGAAFSFSSGCVRGFCYHEFSWIYPSPPHHHHIASFWPFFALFACPSVRSSASLTCYACKSLWQIHRPWATTTNRQMGVTCKIFLHKNVCPPTRIG